MDISALNVASNSREGKPADVRKVVEAAQQFEALLLESFLKPLEDSFSSLPGGDNGLSMTGYRDLGTQTIATALAKAGGLGIADMVVKNLLHGSKLPGKATTVGTGWPNGIKGFSAYADSN